MYLVDDGVSGDESDRVIKPLFCFHIFGIGNKIIVLCNLKYYGELQSQNRLK